MKSGAHGFRHAGELGFVSSNGFLGGVAMATPFYAEFFSWRWVVLLAVPLFLFSLFYRRSIKKLSWSILPMVLLLALHAAALVFSSTPFAGQVVKDLVVASFLLFIFVLADEDMLTGFLSVLIPLALLTALLGLLKAALLDRGYLIGFIANECSYYPAGSALCVNYNNLGFLWLVAALGCMRARFWWIIPILVAAGALSSSRRFIVLMMLLPFLWVMLQGRAVIIKVAFSMILSVSLIYIVSDSVSFERFRFGDEPYKILSFTGGEAGVHAAGEAGVQAAGEAGVQAAGEAGVQAAGEAGVQASGDWSVNRSAPSVMLGTMADGTLGAASRLDFWAQGVSMVSWVPQGWHYHEVFACKFSECTSFHYPHMTIISEWIIGGVLFAVVAIAFFVWPFGEILKARRFFPAALFLLALPYALISGDTVFSLPICISCMLVALGTVEKPISSLRD